MRPISPVIADFKSREVVFAKDQPEYLPLPALRLDDGTVITRWALSWRERWRVLWTGSLWLSQLTFNQALQPQLPAVEPPDVPPQPMEVSCHATKACSHTH